MAVDMFLKLDGIKGESKDAKHKDEIHIESFSWSLNQPHDVHGGGMATGKLQVTDIKIHKYVDASSPDLLLCISNGKHIKEGLITVRKAGENPVEYLKIKLTQVLITELDYQGQSEGGGEEELIEVVGLSFATYHVAYQEQGKDGKPSGSPKEMGWDLKANAKL
jgi:type VI secretion system secreted protein Hcp